MRITGFWAPPTDGSERYSSPKDEILELMKRSIGNPNLFPSKN